MGLAQLESAKNILVHQVVNGEYTLSFILPHSDDDWKHIKEENLVKVEGQLFRIRSFENRRDSLGRLASNVQCEHISYDLNDVKHLPNMSDIINVTPVQVFMTGYSQNGTAKSGILSNTPFTLTSSVGGTVDLFLKKTTPRAVLNHFLQELDCEAVYDNRSISLVQRQGSNRGVQFVLGKNLQSVKRKTDSSALVTRLYPYGKDYLDITSVNSGNAYIDSPLINLYDYIHSDYIDFSDIDSPSELKAKALEKWSNDISDGIDKPKVTYEVNVLELKKLDEYARFEAFSLGDTVRVIDELLGIDVNARILEYDYYPYEAEKSSIVLSNFKENIGGVFAELIKAKNLVEQIVTSKGEVSDAYIESVRQTMQMSFNSSLSKKAIIHDYADIWVDNVANPTAAIALVDGMFALANSKNPNGTWNWRTIGNAGKLVADEVAATWVYAGSISAGQITAGTINTNSINLASSDGKLTITGNKISMKDYNSNAALAIAPMDGIRFSHKFDALGRPLRTTSMDSAGAGITFFRYDTNNPSEQGTGVYYEYLSGLYVDTLGGGTSDPTIYSVFLTSPLWANTSLDPKVIVCPNETLRFVRPDGGHLNDITQYKCSVSSIERESTGIIVNVESWKTYVYSISGSTVTYRTGSLKFNVLAAMA